MLRSLLAVLLIVHGVVHFTGLIRAYLPARVPSFTTYINKPTGLDWALAGSLFIMAGVLLSVNNGSWWMVAGIATLISQILIILNWHDARFGTVANIILLIAAFTGAAVWDFRTRYTAAVERTSEQFHAAPAHRIAEHDLASLPPPVQRYLRAAGVVGTLQPRSMRIEFDGSIRGFDGPWMPFTSVQTNRFDAPARFFWIDATMMGLPTKGLHAYENGKATMLIKLLGVVPVMEAHGPEMDQAETVTWFNDLCIYAPGALLDPRIVWSALDDHSSEATFTNGALSISATLVFNAADRLVDFTSDDRYALADGKAEPLRFSTPLRDHRAMHGLVLPSYGEAVWHRPEGPFVYGRFTLRSITYDV
ncbi:MAG: DUF6544 family protein [Flavobacteriales bacterium]